MTGAAAIVRSELRRQWRAWLLLGVLTGLVSGAVLAAVAGTRRTATAFDRMITASHAADLSIDADAEVYEAVASVAGVAAVDRVTSAGQLILPVVDGRLTELVGDALIAVVDDDVLSDLGGAVIVEGRAPEPGRHEVIVNTAWVEQMGGGVGDEIPLYNFDELAATGRLPEQFEDLAAAFERDPTLGHGVVVEVVGRFVRYVDFVRDAASRPAYLVVDTPTAAELNNIPVGESELLFSGGEVVSVRYAPDADPDDVAARIGSLPMKPTRFTQLVDVRRTVADAVRPYLAALVAFAVLTAIAGFTVIGAALVRQSSKDAGADSVLRALGADRPLLRAVRVGRAALPAVVALVVATCVAVLVSPVFPIGPVADAEVHPGVAVDAVVLALGVVVTAGFVVAAYLAGAQLAPAGIAASARRPPVAAVARVLPLPIALGTTLAFPGRGQTRVVMRSALIALTAAVLTGSAVGTFGAGVGRLLNRPTDYGWTWDAAVTCNQGYCDLDPPEFEGEFERTRVLDSWTFVNFSSIRVGGRSIPTVAYGFARGDLVPATIIDGRAPTTNGEIALGATVMSRLDVRVGDDVRIDGQATQRFEVVGVAVFPGIGLADQSRPSLGDGAMVTLPALRDLEPGFGGLPDAAIVAGPGDSGRVAEALRNDFPRLTVLHDQRPGAVESWSSLRALPLTLGAVIGVLALGTLAHALALSARLRRAEFAVLVALGITGAQLRRVLHWQAATLLTVSFAVGAPLGYIAGRVAWHTLTRRLGLKLSDPVVVTPLVVLVLVGGAGAMAVALVLRRSVTALTSAHRRAE